MLNTWAKTALKSKSPGGFSLWAIQKMNIKILFNYL